VHGRTKTSLGPAIVLSFAGKYQRDLAYSAGTS
jgi:hypothetical protein